MDGLAPMKRVLEAVSPKVDTKVALAKASVTVGDVARKSKAELSTCLVDYAPLVKDPRGEELVVGGNDGKREPPHGACGRMGTHV